MGGRLSGLNRVPRVPKPTLTRTHSGLVPRPVRRVVTVQSFVRVAEVGLIADVPCLFGTGPTASTAVPQQAHSGGAAGLRARALAGPVTELLPRARLRRVCRPPLRRRARRPAAPLHRVTQAPLEAVPQPKFRDF